MIEIPLTQGKFAIVDDCDADLAQFKWQYVKKKNKNTGYASCCVKLLDGKWKTMRMHRVILERKLGRPLEAGEVPDHHPNPDGCDNRRANLRLATVSQNLMNRRGAQSNSKTGLLGVSPSIGKYRAQIGVGGELFELGRFSNPIDAAVRREVAADHMMGDHAPGSQLVWDWLLWWYRRKEEP